VKIAQKIAFKMFFLKISQTFHDNFDGKFFIWPVYFQLYIFSAIFSLFLVFCLKKKGKIWENLKKIMFSLQKKQN